MCNLARRQVNFNCVEKCFNRPRSIYQYSNMAPRLPTQISKFGVVFFVSKSLQELRDKRNFN